MSGSMPRPPVGRYVKTEAGRAEIRQRALPLSRPARNLLLIIDASRSAADWLGLVQACGPAELQVLLAGGLVAAAMPDGAPPPAAAPEAAVPPAAEPARMTLAQALETKGFAVLCRRMIAQARPRLGAIKGYWLSLEVDHCTSAADARALALRFVEQVREADGDAAAIALTRLLLAPD